VGTEPIGHSKHSDQPTDGPEKPDGRLERGARGQLWSSATEFFESVQGRNGKSHIIAEAGLGREIRAGAIEIGLGHNENKRLAIQDKPNPSENCRSRGSEIWGGRTEIGIRGRQASQRAAETRDGVCETSFGSTEIGTGRG